MSVGKLIPPRVPLTDPRTGLIGREWYLFFQSLYGVVGDTEAGNASLENLVNCIVAAAAPPNTSALTNALNDLSNVVMAAGRPANDMHQRIDLLEAQIAALHRQINTSEIKNSVEEIRAYTFGAN